jgi:hypothetical protein
MVATKSIVVPDDTPHVLVGMYCWLAIIGVENDFLRGCYWNFHRSYVIFDNKLLFYHRNIKGEVLREAAKAKLAGRPIEDHPLGLVNSSSPIPDHVVKYATEIRTRYRNSDIDTKFVFQDIERLYIPYAGIGPDCNAVDLTFQYLMKIGYTVDYRMKIKVNDDLNMAVVRRFGNFNPTYYGLQTILKYLTNIAKSVRMVSIASGIGFAEYWLKVMALETDYDLSIDCYDAGFGAHDERMLKQNSWLYPTIGKSDGLILDHDVIMLAWPPESNPLAFNVIRNWLSANSLGLLR